MEVTAGKTTIEYDCAHAIIEQPINLDRRGRFSVAGKQFPEHGGPTREEDEVGYPARFVGEVRGEEMTLTVTSGSKNETIGTFTLRRGAQSRLMKCK